MRPRTTPVTFTNQPSFKIMANFGLTLKNGTPPANTPFPKTVEGFLELMTSYLEVSGLGDQQGEDVVSQIIAGEDPPTTNLSTTLWLKETNQDRRTSLLAYSGDGFYELNVTNSGAWADKPDDPVRGEVYYATEGFVAIYTGSAWTTLDGSIGDIKHAIGANLQAVLDINPGWREYTAGKGRSLVGVDDQDASEDYHASGNQFGSQTHALDETEMPSHNHIQPGLTSLRSLFLNPELSIQGIKDQLISNGYTSGDADLIVDGWDRDTSDPAQDPRVKIEGLLKNTGGDQPHENRPPSITAFILEKYI